MKGMLCAAVLAAFTTGAFAEELLIVDLTVPNQVTISATDGLSAATVDGSSVTGFYLADFYAADGDFLNETLVSGDLTSAANPSDGTPNLFRGGNTDPGLNIFSFSTDGTVSFTAGSTAFAGSGTWDLEEADYNDMLGAPMSGDIYFPADTVDDIPDAVLLGQYTVIPEPGTFALLAIGLAAGVLRRR